MPLIPLVWAVLVSVVRAEAEADPAIVSHHGTPHHHRHSHHHHQHHHPAPAYVPTSYPSVTSAYHAVSSPYEVVTPAYHAVTRAFHAVTPSYPSVTQAYVYSSSHAYPKHPTPSYHHDASPGYGYKCHGYDQVPSCSYNTTKPWCLYDYEYPLQEISEALHYHKAQVLSLYADVADLYTGNSVNRPKTLKEETYLCPSETAYVRPLRAINKDGYWRTIVNNVKLDYEVLTQTTRVEECLSHAACPLVPECYASKCLQKFIYHRFLVYDPCDEYFPFTIDTFQLPASCACLLGAYTIDH